MHIHSASFLLLLANSVLSAIIPQSFVLHEKRSFDPSRTQWVKRAVAPRDAILPVRIAITQRNAQLGHQHLMDISDPRSLNFGKHWTPQQVQDFFSPHQTTVDSVREWLSSSGIAPSRHKIAGSRGYIQFDASVDEVQRLLGTQYDVWENSETGDETVSCDHYLVPAHMKHNIDFITPTTGLDSIDSIQPSFKKRSFSDASNLRKPLRKTVSPSPLSLAKADSTCADLVTPECIKDLYGIPENTAAVEGNDLGIFESGDTYAQEDLDLFFNTYATQIPNGTHPELKSIAGAVAPVPLSRSGGESTLDFDLAYPIVYPQGIKLYQTLDDKTSVTQQSYGLFDVFLDALDGSYCSYEGGGDKTINPVYPNAGYNGTQMCGTYKATNVISLSYGLAEAYYPQRYEERQCYEYMKLGLQGTSIIFSSGDNGTVARAGVAGCLSDGKDNPNFPASCPYVTSVGATQIPDGGSASDQEVAVDPNNDYAYSSGGGFSNVFARPSYQDEAVDGYLSQIDRDTNLYNNAGRGFPDVSAVGWNIATYATGRPFLNAGTSASAPIFASIINRINGDRISAGKGPIGFLNPTLYSNPDVFKDITEGYNLGCNAQVGFNVTAGWDPVTGLGVPNFEKLREVMLSLP